jgi:ankyrin repeat protein
MDFLSNLFGTDKTKFLNACRLGQIETVERFIKSNKFDINSKNEVGKTGLMCAADAMHKDIVELLIKALRCFVWISSQKPMRVN